MPQKPTPFSLLFSIDKRLANIEQLLTPQDAFKENLKPESWATLHMKPEYTVQYLFNECQKLFSCYSWIDLSKITSERSGDYTISFKENIEADEEHKNKSASDVKDLKTITLEERLLLELQYFKATGNHLDVNNITLCAGSRDSDGHVPSAYWCVSQFRLNDYVPDYSDGGVRARVAV